MSIDVFTSSGAKKGTMDLPASVFGAKINKGLMHLAVMIQQGNRRAPIAHAKGRGEVVGSTKKVYQQKGTGNARRGPIRSPLLRGGGKAFGPKKWRNFERTMPKKMRRAALLSSLSLRAKEKAILGLESYPEDIKTKTLATLLKKLPVPFGRFLIIVTPGRHKGIELSARNIPNVKTLFAQYLNPEDVLKAHAIIFLTDAVKVAEETFGRKGAEEKKGTEGAEVVKKKNPRAVSKKKTSVPSAPSTTSAPPQ